MTISKSAAIILTLGMAFVATCVGIISGVASFSMGRHIVVDEFKTAAQEQTNRTQQTLAEQLNLLADNKPNLFISGPDNTDHLYKLEPSSTIVIASTVERISPVSPFSVTHSSLGALPTIVPCKNEGPVCIDLPSAKEKLTKNIKTLEHALSSFAINGSSVSIVPRSPSDMPLSTNVNHQQTTAPR